MRSRTRPRCGRDPPPSLDAMPLTNLQKTPWPYFGGKADAAEHVWNALGDVDHYCEPFAGSLAVLLRRPHPSNRTYHSETVNDADGMLINAWRSIQLSPDATAEAASWPVAEADLHARHIALVKWRAEHQLEHLMGDPKWHDPVMAGWWIWGTSCWIGGGFCSGTGAWTVGDDGRITKGKGVGRQLPHISSDGQGVNHAGAREPGVHRKLPHISSDGRGVNRPQAREPGVGEFHPMTMPEVRRWFHFLSARLRHVRILNGDWGRLCKQGAWKNLPVRQGGHCGMFLDPPYSTEADRNMSLYAHESGTVAHDVRAWCVENGANRSIRIVLAGYDTEHAELEQHGWQVVEWFRSGFLKGGMANVGAKAKRADDENAELHQQKRERLWPSPHCLTQTQKQGRLF